MPKIKTPRELSGETEETQETKQPRASRTGLRIDFGEKELYLGTKHLAEEANTIPDDIVRYAMLFMIENLPTEEIVARVQSSFNIQPKPVEKVDPVAKIRK